MVTVYLKTGTHVQVRNAKSADAEESFIMPGNRSGVQTLVCKDDGGQLLAVFKLEDISGYMISGEPSSR